MLTTREVADRLRVCPRTVQRLIATGEIRSLKVAGSRRIPEDAVTEYIDRQMRVERAA